MSATTCVAAVAASLGDLAERDAPLGARTTYRVGGRAAILVVATTAADLAAVARAVEGSGLDVLVLGRGSNLLVCDAGFDGVAITLAGGFESIEVQDGAGDGDVLVRAGGAVALPVLARRLADQGLTGLEWAVGVPGSVGGAVRMNAGGHGDDVAGSLQSAEVFNLRDATATVRPASSLELSYRHSNLAADDVVTAATFAVRRGDAAAAKAAIADIVRWRREHQPGGTNAGSVFTNPPGDHAGRLVEAAGAKGLRLGTAMVSEKHSNFIQADPGGRADDVVALIRQVADLVHAHAGVTLSTEVVLVGYEAVT
jgi:UDP-N-acetylmuramate dehydrogenase